MRLAVISVAFVALSAVVATEACGDQARSTDAKLAEIMIADELRTAFYEHAPIILSAALSKTVRSWCSSADRQRIADSSDSNAATFGWLCAKHKLGYFRSVYINGSKGLHGLVCEGGTSSLKYLGTDLVAEVIGYGACVPAEFDGAAYVLDFGGRNAL